MTDSASPQVTIYSTTWCAFCKTERQWLEKLGVAYDYKDIEEDKEAYDTLMAKLGGDFRGVPVTDVAGDMILGFDRPRLTASMETHGLLPKTA